MRLSKKSIRSSGEKKFAAFDFTEDEERVENSSRKMLSKFSFKKQKKSTFGSPLDKDGFRRFFSKPAKVEEKKSAVEPLDVDASDDKLKKSMRRSDERGACSSADDVKIEQNYDSVALYSVDDSDEKSEEKVSKSDASESSGSQSCILRAKRYESLVQDSKHSEPIIVDSDDDCSISNNLSIPASEFSSRQGVSLGDPLMVDAANLSDPEKTVLIVPDYIFHGNMYSMAALLTFSPQGITLEASTHFGTKRSFFLEWAISEIVNIESIRSESLAEISLSIKSKDMKVADKDGITKLNFAVSDPHWAEREEAIKSLDLRYKSCWNTHSDFDMTTSEEDSLPENSKHFMSNDILRKSSKVIVYPKGDPDAVSISTKDIELLRPDSFINDTIIDFYIKHVESRIEPTERWRFHFFNSFFFRKLADLDRDPSKTHEGRVDFQNVRNWTKKVDLFKKDFIFIPVNFSLHWSLIIICYPGEVVNFKDEELKTLSKLPCILHMDSIKGSHRRLGNLFRSYLFEEWKERHNEVAEDISERFRSLSFISLEVPQQQNSYDCGLFLLHYVELFLEMAPVDLNPFNLTESSTFLQRDWFSPVKASEKRAHIRKLMNEIFQNDSLEGPMSPAEGIYASPGVNDGNISVECLQERLDHREGYSCGNPRLDPGQGGFSTSQEATPLRVPHCIGKISFSFGDMQEEAQVVIDKLYNSSPIEERKVRKQMSPSTKKAHCQQAVEVGEPLSTPNHESSSRMHVNLPEYDAFELASRISTSWPLESMEAVGDGDCDPVILIAPSPEKEYVSDSSLSDDELSSHIIAD